MSRHSVREAQGVAAMLRRSGYPDAEVAPQYCIDGEITDDNFYTYTVCVYAGRYQPKTIPPFLLSAMEKTKARLGWK
jgi:hypothetical protein